MNFETIASMSLGTNLAYLGTSVALMTTALLWCYRPATKRAHTKVETDELLKKLSFPGVFIDRSEWRAARGNLLRLEELETQAAQRRSGELYPILALLSLGVASGSLGEQWLSAVFFGLFGLALVAGAFDNLYFSILKRDARRAPITLQ